MARNDLDRLIEMLEASVLFAPDFPSRPRYTHAEDEGLSRAQRARIHDPGLEAVRRAPNHRELADAVRELGREQYDPAVPLLARLWAECALSPVRTAAGHALRAIGSLESRQALQELIEDSDDLSSYLAVLAVFDDDPATAHDRLAPYFEPERMDGPGGIGVPGAVLGIFNPSSFHYGRGGEEVPRWAEPRAPAWFRQDPRWVRLCVDLRDHKPLGLLARSVLRHADPDLVAPALKEARARNRPRVVRRATKASRDLLTRYLRGEHDPVWDELRSHESLGGDLKEEARGVADETMRRVARNADLLADRLAARGWFALSGSLRTSPRPGDAEVIRRIEATTAAPLPISLLAFWEVVGGVDFVWDYQRGPAPSLGADLPMDEMDPLCVDPPAAVTWVFEEWEEERDGVDPELADPFHLPLAPDDLHKANVSGGGPYGIELPFPGADPVFADEPHELPFVDYLRLAFRWAGFPHLERHADRPDVRAFLKEMGEGLEPF